MKIASHYGETEEKLIVDTSNEGEGGYFSRVSVWGVSSTCAKPDRSELGFLTHLIILSGTGWREKIK